IPGTSGQSPLASESAVIVLAVHTSSLVLPLSPIRKLPLVMPSSVPSESSRLFSALVDMRLAPATFHRLDTEPSSSLSKVFKPVDMTIMEQDAQEFASLSGSVQLSCGRE